MRRIVTVLSVFASIALAGSAPALAQADDFAFDVDLELALAVDASRSMDVEEQRIQREGYIAAFRHPDVIEAVRSGVLGRIAVTYFEWAGPSDRTMVVPWMLIASAQDGEALASRLARAPPTRVSGTSISGAILFAADRFGEVFTGYRRTIDISGDGPNNTGRPVAETRDWMVARGVTINGLPIVLNQAYGIGPFGLSLDIYYEDCVIGGPGAFMIPVRDIDNFAAAIRRKLILEIAGLEPTVIAAAAPVARPPRVDCMIGEKSRRGWYFQNR